MKRNIKEINRKVYDKWANSYDKSCWVRWILSWADKFKKEVPENSSILDIACGTGDVLLFLGNTNPEFLAGIDISSKAVEKTRKKLEELPNDIKIGDAENNIPWPDKTFDVVTITSAIHHFPNPEKVLFEANRILKNKGKLIVADPFFFFPILQIINLFLKIYPLHGDLRFFSQASLKKLVQKCGFNKIQQNSAGFFAGYTVGIKQVK